MHNHPVEGGLVFKPEGYVYGSAKNYRGKRGCWKVLLLLNNTYHTMQPRGSRCALSLPGTDAHGTQKSLSHEFLPGGTAKKAGPENRMPITMKTDGYTVQLNFTRKTPRFF